MGALRQRGLVVQAFKVGPDQLDPLLHEAATGRPSYNLDGYLRTRRANVARVAALAEPGDVDVAVVEGGESLFDADDAAVGERGGAAQMAKWLGAPVVLVIDCGAQSARGVAAVVRGHVSLDDELAVAGVVLNKLESAAHEAATREALRRAAPGVPVLGALRRDAAAATLGPGETRGGDERDAFAAAAARAAAALGAGGGASIGGALVGLGNFSAEKRRAFAFEDDAGSPTSEAGSEGDFPPADLRNGKRDEEIDARESDSRRALKQRLEQRLERPMRTSSVKTGGSFVAGIAAQLAHVVGEGVDLNAVLGVAWPFVAEPAPSGMSSLAEERDLDAKAEPPGALDDARAAAETAGETTGPETERADDFRAPPPSPPPSSESPARPHTPSGPKRTPSKRASLRGTLELVGNVASHLGPALRLGRGVGNLGASHLLPRPLFTAHGGGVRVGIARDAAFCHYFRDNLLALERAGAELAPFSPVAGDPLPPNCKGLLFGGGYPELYARELANNRGLRAAVTAFAAAGGAVYAECGGLAFLSQSISVDFGKAAMCGLAPFSTRVSLKETHRWGYVRVVAREGCPLFPAGSDLRGYARRRSAVVAEPALAAGPGTVWGTQNGGEGDTPSRGGRWFAAYDVFRAGEEEKERGTRPETTSSKAEMDENVSKEGVVRAAVRAIESADAPRRANDVPGIGRVEGYAWRNVVASYARLHFGDAPEVAAHFVDACRAVPQAAAEAAVRAAAAAEAAPPPVPTGRSSAPSLPQLEAFEKPMYGLGGSPRGGGGSSDSLSALDAGRVDRSGPASPARARVPGGASSREHSAASSSADLASLAEVGLVRVGGAGAEPGSGDRRAPDALGGFPGSSGALSSMGSGSPRGTSIGGAFGALSGAPRLEPGSRASRDRRIDAIDAASEASEGVINSGHSERARSSPVVFSHRRAKSEDVDAEWVGRRDERSGRAAVMNPSSPSDVSVRNGDVDFANSRVNPKRATDAISKSQSSGVLFHRSHSAASFGSGSASANAASPTTAHLELEAFLSFPPVSGSQVGLAELSFGDDVSGAHLHTPAATPQPAPDPECTIACLSPAATEIVHALGLQSRLACVTDRCDYPPTVARAFPIVLRSREPRGAGARGRMGGRRESIGTAMYNAEKANGGHDVLTRARRAGRGVGSPRTATISVDIEWLRRSRPGLVLAQDACGRCAGGAGDGVVARALREAGLLGESLKQSDARRTGVLALDPQRLGEVLETVQQIGAATGERDAAAALVGQLRARLRAVAARTAGAPRKPRVLSLEGLRPFAVGGHWLPEMKQLAGGADELQEPGAPATALRWEQVLSYAPEALILAPCVSGTPEETLLELERLAALPGWWAIPAVRDREVYVAHHAFFSRAGPRLVVGVELLAKMLHPARAADVAMPEGHGAWKMRMDPGKRCRPRQLKDFFHEWGGGGLDGWA
jgi:cobyrinic acid a,c-diamide synthase/ABC-type Fe3+-hydroxamate transport system substrate-binding protein